LQRLENVSKCVRGIPLRTIVARNDAKRLSERVQIGRRQPRNQNRGKLGSIERSLFQANAFSRQNSQ
jgi:hypothetical protein